MKYTVLQHSEIPIPKEVAVCAACETKVTAYVDGWTECEEFPGYWKADSVSTVCGTDVEVCNEMGRNLMQHDFMVELNAALKYINERYRWRK